MKEDIIYLNKENNFHFFPNPIGSNFNTIEILLANIVKPDEKIFIQFLTLRGNDRLFSPEKDVMTLKQLIKNILQTKTKL